MSSKIWEVHSQLLGGAIRTTPDGDADISGLVLSEKAYLLAVRDFRPRQIVEMVRKEGVSGAIDHLLDHYQSAESLNALGGRCLVICKGSDFSPVVRRSDEVAAKKPAFALGR